MPDQQPIKKKLTDLVPDARNANRGTERGLRMLDDSLREDGAGRGILLDKNNNVIAGNKTLERAVDLGFEEVIIVPTDGKQIIATQRIDVDIDSVQGRRMALRDNRVGQVDLDFDPGVLWELADEGVDLAALWTEEELTALTGQDWNTPGEATTPAQARKTLAERFIIPPFSVLDARQGYWQSRKQAWIGLGIQSELGRGNENLGMAHPETTSTINFYSQKRKLENELGRELSKDETAAIPQDRGFLHDDRTGNSKRIKGRMAADNSGHPLPLDRTANGRGLARTFGQDLMRGEHVVGANGKLKAATYGAAGKNDDTSRKNLAANPKPAHGSTVGRGATVRQNQDGSLNYQESNGTSIFDPVLCELAYRWFCPKNARVLDPFAGGSVRGIVANYLGYHYTGIDLRPEQIAANEVQAKAIIPDNLPRWITGDSRNLKTLSPDPCDFIFSCPPYFDLEIYSDDTNDLSNAGDYAAFMDVYCTIIKQAVDLLADNRFACFVVGDIRDKRGLYRNFPSDTIAAFQDAGAMLYNEAILVTAVGSLPIRVAKQFAGYRKLGKTHQNVLVFFKGDPKTIKSFGEVEADYSMFEDSNDA